MNNDLDKHENNMWVIAMEGQEGGSPWYWGRDARGTWGWLGGEDSAYQYPTREAAAELAHAFIASGHHKDSVIGLQEVIVTEIKAEKTST